MCDEPSIGFLFMIDVTVDHMIPFPPFFGLVVKILCPSISTQVAIGLSIVVSRVCVMFVGRVDHIVKFLVDANIS